MNNLIRILIKSLVLISIIPFFVFGCNPSEAMDASRADEHYLKKYNFTTDWVTYNIPVWKELLNDFKGKPSIAYLEVGVFEGRSILWMLENILTHATSTAIGIDPLGGPKEKILFSNLEISGLKSKVKIIKGYSQVELMHLPNNSFDIIYIDGDHIAPNVLVDTVLSWSLLKKGGLIIFDDYNWRIEERPPTRRPKIAIDAFLANYKEYIDIIHLQYQCIIRKNTYFYWEKDTDI